MFSLFPYLASFRNNIAKSLNKGKKPILDIFSV